MPVSTQVLRHHTTKCRCAQLSALHATTAGLGSGKQEATRKLQVVLEDGRRTAYALRAGLKNHYGPTSEALAWSRPSARARTPSIADTRSQLAPSIPQRTDWIDPRRAPSG
jgi:hypothetical protein